MKYDTIIIGAGSAGSILATRLTPLGSDLQSDESLNYWFMKEVTTGHHISCTNKMGPKSDLHSVVGQTGKVHGIKSLRVVDASIMPECVRANINVTVMAMAMAMAEKISDFIKAGS